MIELLHGDCLDRLRELPDCSVDACVTDPPYGLSFMGKAWDYDVPGADVWREVLRVLKPGGHLLAFAGTRTQHRMAVQIEDAGFEIRDLIAWVYGSGFPKSLDVSKAIDKAAGAEREVVGSRVADDIRGGNMHAANRGERHVINITAPATPEAQQWTGWGTALKPALEPITVARKPLMGTVAANVLEHGTGAINVDGCRVTGSSGRWPANLIHDGSDEVVGLFPESNSSKPSANGRYGEGKGKGAAGVSVFTTGFNSSTPNRPPIGDSGSAARFFYCAKASKKDRDEGLTLPPQSFVQFQTGNGASGKPSSLSEGRDTQYRNTHPTVKPTELMRYLCRLVTPPGGVVLDPFMGSGSTGKAAVLEGFRFIGIEREAEYLEIARGRIQLPEQGSLL
jgi:DNA modification methylase